MNHLIHQWNLWKFRRHRRAIKKTFADKDKLLREKGSSNPYAAAEVQYDEYLESRDINEWIDAYRSDYLIDQAIELDVETPPVSDDSEFRTWTDDGEHCYLSRKGRDLLQDLINKKKDRDSEDWARFSRTFVPIISSIAGLIGVITGLVAVFRHAK